MNTIIDFKTGKKTAEIESVDEKIERLKKQPISSAGILHIADLVAGRLPLKDWNNTDKIQEVLADLVAEPTGLRAEAIKKQRRRSPKTGGIKKLYEETKQISKNEYEVSLENNAAKNKLIQIIKQILGKGGKPAVETKANVKIVNPIKLNRIKEEISKIKEQIKTINTINPGDKELIPQLNKRLDGLEKERKKYK